MGIALFGVIAVAALGFLATGSKTYSKVNGAINQRLDAQLAINQIAEYIVDCNGSVSFKNHRLTIVSLDVDGSVVTDVFTFSSADRAIYYGTGTEQALLADDVTAFSVAFLPEGGDSATGAKITLTTSRWMQELVLERTVALRNKPTNNSST